MFALIQLVVTICVFIMALLPTILYFKKQKKAIEEKYRIVPTDTEREKYQKEKTRRIEVRHTFFLSLVIWVVIESIIFYAFQMLLSIPGLANIGTFIVIPLVAAGFYFELQYFIKLYKKIDSAVSSGSDNSQEVRVNKNRSNDTTSLRDKMKNQK